MPLRGMNRTSAFLNIEDAGPRKRDCIVSVSYTHLDVYKRQHVSTGVLGIQHLMRGLTQYGNVDLAYKIATNDTYPSWGYMVRKGATTIWELWNGDTADPAMNSGNHVMLLGDLIIWYYEDPVSYTHLDVYKRQEQEGSYSCWNYGRSYAF